MYRKLLIGIIGILCLACGVLCSMWWGYPALLTLLYGREMEQALQHYWDISRDPETFRDPARLSEVSAGRFLTSTMGLYSTFEKPPREFIACHVTIQFVEEYSQKCSRVSAHVVCGNESGPTGQYIFSRQEDRWKVVNFWQGVQTHNELWPDPPPPTCKDVMKP